jgi:hypothetical protein
METLPPPAAGFVRVSVRLPRGEAYTPGELARLSGLAAEHLGPVQVHEGEGTVDIPAAMGKTVRERLERVGPTKLVGWQWQWLKLHLGRNHGLAIGQLRKIMLKVDALPLGRIDIRNTHSLIGIQDFKLPAVMERLSALRINGFAARPEIPPPSKQLGSPEFLGGGPH